ncbi:hypothetical protein BDM02DRAFT_3122021 [Thelephora ganbajun]|uniref:Uncharacterized protein n=1 Tax=Thelephora ganbajun TaxID=370292 RepID=A0ACB6Z3T2_THEGA|nr:hypothetical protein BDM02DRAFT_3122021 [Thelephora ganbajun]
MLTNTTPSLDNIELTVLPFSDDPPFHPAGDSATPDLITLWCEPGNYSRMVEFVRESHR